MADVGSMCTYITSYITRTLRTSLRTSPYITLYIAVHRLVHHLYVMYALPIRHVYLHMGGGCCWAEEQRGRARESRRSVRGSPYNHPPSRKASTRCLDRKRNRAEGDRAKSHCPDPPWGGWIALMKFRNLFGGIVNILRVLPGVSFRTVTFPFNQVLKAPPE